jgi:hypothetical protein
MEVFLLSSLNSEENYSILVNMHFKTGVSFISNRQLWKEATYCASELAGIEPTPPALEEQGMPTFTNYFNSANM